MLSETDTIEIKCFTILYRGDFFCLQGDPTTSTSGQDHTPWAPPQPAKNGLCHELGPTPNHLFASCQLRNLAESTIHDLYCQAVCVKHD